MSGDELISKIDARTFFIRMHEQLVFWSMGLLKGECYTVAEDLSMGMYPSSSSSLQGSGVRVRSRSR